MEVRVLEQNCCETVSLSLFWPTLNGVFQNSNGQVPHSTPSTSTLPLSIKPDNKAHHSSLPCTKAACWVQGRSAKSRSSEEALLQQEWVWCHQTANRGLSIKKTWLFNTIDCTEMAFRVATSCKYQSALELTCSHEGPHLLAVWYLQCVFEQDRQMDTGLLGTVNRFFPWGYFRR